MIIREVENPTLRDLFGGNKHQPIEKYPMSGRDILDKIKVVGSGKGAIALVLKYLSEKKIILNKLSEVIVPDWLGYWVYNQVQAFAFPAKRFSARTKALFIYHQYGFPQNMDKILEFAHDKKLIVIEDCAHALASYYKKRLLGSIGDFSIYSFSKWFFCFALGGVRSKFEDFYIYANKSISQVPFGITFVKDLAKFLYERSAFSNCNLFKKYSNLFMEMSYSLYGEALKPSRLAIRLVFSKIDYEIHLRQERYRHFRNRTDHLGICDHLENEGVTPYVIPIRCSESKNEKLVNLLRNKGIITGIYHFDIERNLLFPKFIKCVWVPCHGGISDDTFGVITETVLKVL